MRAAVARSRAEAVRKRRTHAKSRNGCGNCKLRRIKCDEAQPSCQKCRLYGVACNYSEGAGPLDLDAHGSFQVHFESSMTAESYVQDDRVLKTRVSACDPIIMCAGSVRSISFNMSLATMISDSLRSNTPESTWMDTSYNFTPTQLQIVSRFRERTSLTIGNPQMAPLYRDLVCELACKVQLHKHPIFVQLADHIKHPFLMHMLLSVTLMHDVHLSAGTITSCREALEHWTTASTLFNDVLSQPIPPSYRDAVWATGIFLGAASFWSIGSTDPHAVWPLKASEPDDLAWLRIGEGKKHLWRVAQPTRADSIFCKIVKDYSCLNVPQWTADEMTTGPGPHIAAHVVKTLGLTDVLDDPGNVYHLPILALSRCPNAKVTEENALKFLYVMAVITEPFLKLLEAKDMKAVFIMGWWYILLTKGDMWWMSRRARIEGQAVRIWLRRQCGGEELADLLDEIERYSWGAEVAGKWFFEARGLMLAEYEKASC